MTLLITLFARWGLPEGLRRPLALLTAFVAVAGLCALLWSCWLSSHDAEVIDEHEAAVTAQVIEASASASIAAVESAAATKSKVEKQNDDARKAADGCADVLKCGLDRMRERTR
ncbi:hypothetical protein [Novosphingobium sp.]|uniref:hypothetical protein n=1 Tax=Novosphingobium sp. TaxID=1874826 RepID=UPI00286E1FD3|nr:hypothetical protein [Novosphingobium sp.]